MSAQVDGSNVVAIPQFGVTRVAEKLKAGLSGEAVSPLDRLSVVQDINRKWARFLDAYEYRVVSYILDRTVLWGRETFRACHDNILNGTDDFAGIGLKRAKYLTTLKALEDRGIIIRKRARDFVTLGLNLFWVPEADMKLPVPKRKANPEKGQKSTRQTSKSPRAGLQKSTSWTQKKENIEKENYYSRSPDGSGTSFPENPKIENSDPGKSLSGNEIQPDFFRDEISGGENCNGLHAADRMRDTLSARMEKQAMQRAAAADKAKTKRAPNSADVEIVWKAAMAETFPSVNHVGWGVRQRAIIKNALKKYVYGNTVTLPALLDWSVRRWTRLLRTKLKFMTDPPKVPNINFLISEGVLRLLAEAYDSGELERMADGAEENELKRLMLLGLSEQEALARLGERRARRKMKDRMRESEQTVNRKLREIKDREDRAARLEGVADKLAEAGVPVTPVAKPHKGAAWSPPPVPHPDSPVMQARRREAARQASGRPPVPEHMPLTHTLPSTDEKQVQPKAGPGYETWEELQARLERERAAGEGKTDDA